MLIRKLSTRLTDLSEAKCSISDTFNNSHGKEDDFHGHVVFYLYFLNFGSRLL